MNTWSVFADLVGRLPFRASAAELRQEVVERLNLLLNPPQTSVILPLANVARLQNNLHIGPLLIGEFGESLKDDLRTKLHHPISEHVSGAPWWSAASEDRVSLSPDDPPVVLAG